MSRLPQPGGDDNQWGAILNDFLSQSHNVDGTLKTTSVNQATTSTPGMMQLAGDLSGTATMPTVPGLATKASINHTHTITMSLTSFYQTGMLSVTTGTQYLPVDGAYTIVGVRLAVGTPSAGASIIVDVKKNNVTIFTTQANRPTLAAGASSYGPGPTPDVTSLSAGDLLSVDIAQVGSTTAGSNLTVSVIVSKTIS